MDRGPWAEVCEGLAAGTRTELVITRENLREGRRPRRPGRRAARRSRPLFRGQAPIRGQAGEGARLPPEQGALQAYPVDFLDKDRGQGSRRGGLALRRLRAR
jgi:hypothetical protein